MIGSEESRASPLFRRLTCCLFPINKIRKRSSINYSGSRPLPHPVHQSKKDLTRSFSGILRWIFHFILFLVGIVHFSNIVAVLAQNFLQLLWVQCVTFPGSFTFLLDLGPCMSYCPSRLFLSWVKAGHANIDVGVKFAFDLNVVEFDFDVNFDVIE